MTKLFLVRHGESTWNLEGKVQGQHDTHLTKKGISQATALGNRLRSENIHINSIYSSDLKRAFETAKTIHSCLNNVTTFKKNIALRERHFGLWQGLNIDDIKSKYKKDYDIWKKTPHQLIIENGESLQDVQKRVMKFIDRLIHETKDANILIVSHTVVLKLIILGLLKLHIKNYSSLKLSNTSLSIIEIPVGKRPFIRVLNDTCHLKGLK
ncbi:histidine phosphatase family protein [Clostridiisalibacter paucivorans]|uniref:histidine phosphatase family protein n=1 Tax=Clostridiisalibacter paucivorans TaxID=408753 RepID=UPI000688CA8E|nr:histidine phosphatase family protein [Clostridiisalibacter paucivorans]